MPASATAKVTSAGPPSAAQPTSAVSAWPNASRPHGNPPHGIRSRSASITTHSSGTVRTHHRRDSRPGSSAPAPAQNEAHSSDRSTHASGPRTRIQSSRSRKNTIPVSQPEQRTARREQATERPDQAGEGGHGRPAREEVEGRERQRQQRRSRGADSQPGQERRGHHAGRGGGGHRHIIPDCRGGRCRTRGRPRRHRSGAAPVPAHAGRDHRAPSPW